LVTHSPSRLILFVLGVLWQRSRLAMVPVLVILPLGLAFAKFGPKTYAAKTLMLLQENARASPFASELPIQSNLQGRIAGLQALLKSERVLLRVMSDIEGADAPTDKKAVATWLKRFSSSLSLELVGNDFLEFQLTGKSPVGLGKQLEAVTSRFLEALLSSQDAISATAVLIARKEAELDAVVKEYEQLRAALGRRSPRDRAAAAAALERRQTELGEKVRALSALAAELEQQRRAAAGGDAVRVSAAPGADRPPADRARLTALEARHAALAAEVVGLERARDALQLSSSADRGADKRLGELEQAVRDKRRSLEDYAKRFVAPLGARSTSILLAPERIKVIDEPRDPELPTTSALKIAIAAVAASLLAACGLVFLAELVDTTVRRGDQIEALTGAPVLARLPPA
jgi:uncharacterized protein involved in exopolysaccharide biosynthesis